MPEPLRTVTTSSARTGHGDPHDGPAESRLADQSDAAPPASRTDDGLSRPITGDRYCHVAVVLPDDRRMTLQLPSRVPVAELADLVLRDIPTLGDVMFPPVWTLGEAGRPNIPLADSLADAGVLDGAILEVRDSAADEIGRPLVLDVPQLLADARDDVDSARWTPSLASAAAEPVGYLAAAAVALASLLVTAGDGARAAIGAICVVAGIALLGAAHFRHRGPKPSPVVAGIAAWCAVVVFGVAARYSVAPDDLTSRIGIGVALGAVFACVAVPTLEVLGPALVAVVAGCATALLAGFGAQPPEPAAVAGALGASLAVLTPGVSARLGAVVDGREADASPNGHDSIGGLRIPVATRPALLARWESTMRQRVVTALGQVRRVLVASYAVAATCVVIAEAELCRADSVYTAVEAAVIAAVLAFRTPLAQRRTEGTVLLAGAVAAGLILLAVLPGRWAPGWVGPVLAVASALAVAGVGAATADRGGQPSVGSEQRYGDDTLIKVARLVSVLLVAASVAMTVGAFGVFEHFWNVGRSL